MGKEKEIDLKPFKKGQVWYLQDELWSDEQKESDITVGNRPVLIYNEIDVIGKFVTVIPITGTSHGRNGVPISLEEDRTSIVLVQEIRPVPVKRLTRFLGSVSDRKLNEIDTAVKIYFGLDYSEELHKQYFPIAKKPKPLFDEDSKSTVVRQHTKSKKFKYTNEPKTKRTTTTVILTPEIKEVTSTTKKKYTVIDITTLTDDDKLFFINNTGTKIQSKYNICINTAYKYKKLFKEEMSKKDTISTITDTETPETKIVDDKYSSQTYRQFANKQVKLMTREEKILFTRLRPEKLAPIMLLSENTIIQLQKAIREKLHLKK